MTSSMIEVRGLGEGDVTDAALDWAPALLLAPPLLEVWGKGEANEPLVACPLVFFPVLAG